MMNRENVSNMIAAGVDRWQNTIEDMIHLRSSGSQPFRDNWAQNGFEELRRYVKQGADFTKELASILHDRVEAEIHYSKCLVKLGTKLGKACKENTGSCTDAWKQVAAEMERRAEIHRNFSTALSEELVKPLKHVIDHQLKLRKKIEGKVDKATRTLTDLRNAEAKSKKQSHIAARENEKLQDSTVDHRLARSASMGQIPRSHSAMTVSRNERLNATAVDRDNVKLKSKKRKTEDAVKKTEILYYNVCVQAERARLEWESSVVRGSGLLELLEEERLVEITKSASCYLKLTLTVPSQLAEISNTLVAPIQSCDPESDMSAVRGIRAAPPGPSQQLLPDFYCEHTTLAMNRERRKQALLKILHLVKEDIERERKSKQGLEKLSLAIKQTPTFGGDESQQNVADKLYHMRSMLTYLEAVRYKVASSLNQLDNRPPIQHPLALHIQIVRDKQGLQHSILKVPPWLQRDYQNEVNENLQPNYTTLAKSVSGSEEKEKRDPILCRASSKLRIEHLSFRRRNDKGGNSKIYAEIPSAPDLQSTVDSNVTWSERGVADGVSNRQDSDFDGFSSQSDSSAECTENDISTNKENASAREAHFKTIGKCRALYLYEARLSDELNLSPGDIISIHEKQDDVWWSGELNGARGLFPASYVSEITSCI